MSPAQGEALTTFYREILIYALSLPFGGVIRHHPSGVIVRVIEKRAGGSGVRFRLREREGDENQIKCNARATASASSRLRTPSLL